MNVTPRLTITLSNPEELPQLGKTLRKRNAVEIFSEQLIIDKHRDACAQAWSRTVQFVRDHSA